MFDSRLLNIMIVSPSLMELACKRDFTYEGSQKFEHAHQRKIKELKKQILHF
jgi:hypothetical protein